MVFIHKKKLYKYLFAAALLVLVFIMLLSCTLGAANISIIDSLRIILSGIPLLRNIAGDETIPRSYHTIVWTVRMPRIFLSALIGAGLSIVGSAFQGMFRNPMADPYILGISSGASAGAAIAIVLGLGGVIGGLGIIALFAFAGAVLTALTVYNLARTGSRVPTLSLILAGVAVGFFLSSLVSMLMFFNRDKLERIVMWIMGSVSAASWNQVGILFPVVIIGSVILLAFARDLNAMSTGEDTAKSLGIEVEKVKKLLVAVSSLIIACCVSTSGVIGFVGLIVPHSIRLVLGSDQRVVMPFSAAVGAIFMVACDTLARNLIPPSEIPVGVVTSMLGAPFFIYLLYRNKKKVA
ncbi:MAG TPA: iron chelate uptake ABC transporter family permease subunit [Clostridiales bacterium]|nr:iron chelate uptake ABC transporter family permease subunit [Clostridiales bacterium]